MRSDETFGERVIAFNQQLEYTGRKLPKGIRVMNPFREYGQTLQITNRFYHKYYNDRNTRVLILGINPGRFGAGMTGIPFTDPKRLQSACDIKYEGKTTHEPSSVFIYEMIDAFGGPAAFYGKFYINSMFPLGFTKEDKPGKEKNYNYYDSKELFLSVKKSIVDNITTQIKLGVRTDVCFCFGTGKNEKHLKDLNEEHRFFKKIVALEHPRFIMQYRTANKQAYIDKYLDSFRSAL